MEESIYNLIPQPVPPIVKPERYTSKHAGDKPPTFSTFGLAGTSKPGYKNIQGAEGGVPEGHHIFTKSHATMGKEGNMRKPAEMLKKGTGMKPLPPQSGGPGFTYSEMRKPSVPTAMECHELRQSMGPPATTKNFITSNAVENILAGWSDNPLIKRKPTKTYNPTEFAAEQQAHLQSRVFDIDHGGKDIHKLLLASNRELKVSKGAPAWKNYVDYVNEVVVDGLARTVCNSLRFVCEQIDLESIARHELLPFLEVQIELLPPQVQFQPPLSGPQTGDDPCEGAGQRVEDRKSVV